MNVIVSNKQKDIIDNANIDAIKDLTGLFNVDDLIAKFKNYFFSKMILDVTSVENFTSREVLQKLVTGIGSDRLIVLLPQTPEPPNEFKKMLIDLKIYNFSNNINDVVKFIDNPNTYETVMRGMDNDFYNNSEYVDNSIKGVSTSDNQANGSVDSFNSSASLHDALESFNIKDNSSSDNNSSIENSNGSFVIPDNIGINNNFDNNINTEVNQSGDSSFTNLYDMNNNLDNNTEENDGNIDINSYDMPNLSDLYNIPNENNNINSSLEENIEQSIDNNQDNSENIANEENESNHNDMNNEMSNNSIQNKENDEKEDVNKSNHIFLNIDGLNDIGNDGKIVIGFKNITNHAGSTSLIYMILKEMNDNMKKDVLAVEVNKDDFKLFMNSRMVKVLEKDVNKYLSERYERIILVDLNDCVDTSFCDDIIYLIEPSTVMLNKLMLENRNIFKELSNQKVVLNKSMLSKEDVNILSNEAGMKFIYSIGPLNDRLNNEEIVKFIDVLGLK